MKRSRFALLATLCAFATSNAQAQLCRPDSATIAARIARPVSYIFFGRDHQRVDDAKFLDHRGVAGAQLTFTWRELEPTRDRYDFSGIEARLAQLQRHGRRLVVQLQDVSFVDRPLVPDYMLRDTAFHGGAVRKLKGDSAMQSITSDARHAFLRSRVIIYANVMPGAWRPGNDKGYLRAVHEHAARIGAGVGGPDLMPHRAGQRNHAYALIATRPAGTIAGVAVQDGNLAEQNPRTGAAVTVAELATYARDTLRLDFLFWGSEEPYYSRDGLPFLSRSNPRR